jgi:outer membrane protein OmpA-like peptidoglycan-associated protein/flagellar hook assembly protein FlgD
LNPSLIQRIITFLFLLGFIVEPSWAIDPLPVQDAYGIGMGGADSAIVGGTHSIQVNPAGLAQATVPMGQIGLGLESAQGNLDLNNVVLYPLQDGTVFALSQFSGFYNGYANTAIVGSAGLPLDSSRDLSLGLNLKYLLLSNPANSVEGPGRGFGLDLGFTYNLRDTKGTLASFGLTIKDLSSEIRFSNTGEESVTRTFSLGAAYDEIQDTRIEMDADFVDKTLGPTLLHDQFDLGAERFFQDRNFSARVGYNDMFQSDGAFTLGGGYHPAQPFEITYAFEVSADFKQVSNFLTFVYRLDDWNKNKTEQTDTNGEITLDHSAAPEEQATPISHTGRPVSGVPLRKMQVSVDPNLISESGAQKTTQITFPGEKPNDIVGWEILIKNSTGKIYRKIDGTGKPFSAIAWDGSDDSGKMLSEGIYQINLRTFNASNDLLSDDFTNLQIVPARSGFGMTVNSPYLSLAKTNKTAGLLFTPDPGGSYDAPTWEFKVENAGTHQIVYDHKGRVRIPKTLKWNGRGLKGLPVPDGTYDCTLNAVDKLGNLLSTEPVEIYVRSAPPVVGLKGDDHWIDFSQTPKVNLHLSAEDSVGIQNWSVKLLDEDDNVLKTFLGQDAPPEEVVWNGKLDSEEMIPDGSFVRAELLVQDKAGNTAQTDDYPLQVMVKAPAGQASLSLILTTIYFANGTETLSADAKKEIQQAAISIKPYLEKSVFVIKGYANSGESDDLVTLSHDRADSVREYLMKTFGVSMDKVFALGYATRETLKDATGDEPADKQRRATITLYTQP